MKPRLYQRITTSNTSSSQTYHTELKYRNILQINIVINKQNTLLTHYNFSTEICLRENIYKYHISSRSDVLGNHGNEHHDFGMWRHVHGCTGINTLVECIASVICDPTDGDTIFFQTLVPVYQITQHHHPRKPQN